MNKKQLFLTIIVFFAISCNFTGNTFQMAPKTSTTMPLNATQTDSKRFSWTPKEKVTGTPVFGVFTVLQTVYIRDLSGAVVGYLPAGKKVSGSCKGNWCYIAGSDTKLWRGCSSDNPESLGCERR